jgi:hypothetical protein
MSCQFAARHLVHYSTPSAGVKCRTCIELLRFHIQIVLQNKDIIQLHIVNYYYLYNKMYDSLSVGAKSKEIICLGYVFKHCLMSKKKDSLTCLFDYVYFLVQEKRLP